MTNLQKLCILLIVLSLIACDDKAAQPATSVQSFPEFDSFQTVPGIEELKARLALNPNDFSSLSELGDLYFESAQYFEAIQTYDKAIAVNPMCADCFNDKGLSLFYLGDVNAALESFDKAIAVAPEFPHAWLSKGFVLVSAGRYEEAIPVLDKVKELDTTGSLTQTADEFIAQAVKKNYQ
jgi:tetratricopeptide (TPR) repeat protein